MINPEEPKMARRKSILEMTAQEIEKLSGVPRIRRKNSVKTAVSETLEELDEDGILQKYEDNPFFRIKVNLMLQENAQDPMLLTDDVVTHSPDKNRKKDQMQTLKQRQAREKH